MSSTARRGGIDDTCAAAVIARSGATKQSRSAEYRRRRRYSADRDCFVAPLLAMTAAAQVSSMPPLLAVEDIHSYYGKSHILHGISLEVGRGEVVGLLG